MRVNLAYYRDTHIDVASGHEQVRHALMQRVETAYLEPCLPRALPKTVARLLAPPLGRHRKMSFYEPSALPLEYGVVRRLVTAPGDVVHMFQGEPHFNYTAWVRFWPRRGALVVRFSSPPEKFEELWRFRRKRARLSAIDWLTVQSSPGLHYFRELVGERVSVVPIAVNRQVFNPPPGGRPARQDVRSITVGAWLRDPLLLRRAIELVNAETDRVSFTVLAPPDFLEKLGDQPRLSRDYGVYGADLVAAYQSADVLVHPAANFSASTALGEGMACGLPVVVPEVGGIRDYAGEDCAEITPPGDAGAMADAILRLAADPERRTRLGARSEERTRMLDFPYIADEYVQIYERVLARRSGAA